MVPPRDISVIKERVMMYVIPCVAYRRANVLKDWSEEGKLKVQ